MPEKPFFYSPEHKYHEGMVDSEGRQWDVPDRLKSIVRGIVHEYGFSRFNVLREIKESEILPFIERVHSTEMIEAIKQASEGVADGTKAITPYDLDGESSVTKISSNTYKSAIAAVRCSLAVAELLYANTSKLAAALSRPPGHHAGRNFYHGFCYMNNAAIAAEALKAAGKKVAILDLDVHHGDGTQDIFYKDEKVFYSSLHADPEILLPHTGRPEEKGEGPGLGTTLNIPYSLGASVDEYLNALNTAIQSIGNYSPDYLLISAGFDTHRHEFDSFNLPPVTQLDTPDYTEIGKMIGSLSIPSGVILEGGYNREVLGPSFTNLIKGLTEKLKTEPEFDSPANDSTLR